MAVFDILESILLQVGLLGKVFKLSKIKLAMVYNTLKKFFLGSNHLLTITMATMISKSQNGQQQYEGLFCIKKKT